MIFKRLTLTNFRVFNGNHDIDLSPRKGGLIDKPIILFGGLNGAGKTTILTAIRLLLLGRRANANVLTKKEYQSFLAEQINKSALQQDKTIQATVALEFTHTHQGIHKTYYITREWGVEKEESLKLSENGQEQEVMANEQVQSFLFDIIPPGIGDLFFFDGEKIAELAEDDTGVYLKEAVQKLLGLNVIQRLNDDLQIYLTQEKSPDSKKAGSKLDIGALEEEKSLLKAEAMEAYYLASAMKAQLVDVMRNIQSIEEAISLKGGDWAKTHEEQQARLASIDIEIAAKKSLLLNELDVVFPLALAPKAITALLHDLTKEQEIKRQKAFDNTIPNHFDALAKELATQLGTKSNEPIKELIQQYFESQILNDESSKLNLDVSDTDFYRLNQQEEDANASKDLVGKLSKSLSELEKEQTNLNENIHKAPKESEWKELYESLLDKEKEKLRIESERKTELLKAREKYNKALELAKSLEKYFNNQKTASTFKKVEQRVESAKATLSEFSSRLVNLRVKQLEELFVTSYRKLARKGDLKLEAKINPESFDVTLVDAQGVAINRKSLSAGEKQIFAFAILEALGKLSGRVLPVVIDTPLGRLDSKHRDKLIKHYFPEAAEQVILLSTDTEVDENFFSELKHEISHGFEISFDQSSRSSSVTEGYFWQDKQIGVM